MAKKTDCTRARENGPYVIELEINGMKKWLAASILRNCPTSDVMDSRVRRYQSKSSAEIAASRINRAYEGVITATPVSEQETV